MPPLLRFNGRTGLKCGLDVLHEPRSSRVLNGRNWRKSSTQDSGKETAKSVGRAAAAGRQASDKLELELDFCSACQCKM